MHYKIFTRLAEDGEVIEFGEGFFKGETDELPDAERIANQVLGGYVRRDDGAVLAPDGTWISSN